MVERTVERHDGRLVSIGLINRAWRTYVDENLRHFLWPKEIVAGRQQIARLALGVQAVVKERPLLAGLHNAWVGREFFVAASGATVRDDGIARITPPGFEIAGCGNTDLFVPALFSRFGVVEQIESAVIFDQTRLVEAAAFPIRAVLRFEARWIDLPVQQIVAPAESNDGRALFITRIGIGVIDAQEAAAYFFQIAH